MSGESGRTFYPVLLALSDWFDPRDWTAADIDDLRDWLIAVGTVGAVLVALGTVWWAERRARKKAPLLSLGFDDLFGVHRETVFYSTGDTGTGQYVRLGVSNQQGRTAAHDVEVLIGRVSEVPADPKQPWKQIIDISTPALTWTHSDSTRQTIGAGVTRYVDLGVEYEKGPADLVRRFGLNINPPPADGRHLLVSGRYDIVLVLSSRDTDALFYKVRLAFDPGRNILTLVGEPAHVSGIDG